MPASNEAVCRTCGACCAYSATWPRFGLETEAEIDSFRSPETKDRFRAFVDRKGR